MTTEMEKFAEAREIFAITMKSDVIVVSADIILSNSEESRKHSLEYMTVKCQTGILPPAANTYAISKNQNPLTKEDLKMLIQCH